MVAGAKEVCVFKDVNINFSHTKVRAKKKKLNCMEYKTYSCICKDIRSVSQNNSSVTTK